MGGVDRHDELRSTFSLHERHTFLRWYVQLYLCLLDVASTNAKLCYGLKNLHSQRKDKEWGAKFFENISDTLISEETDWGRYFGTKDECSEYLEMENEHDRRQHDLGLLFDGSPIKKRKHVELASKAVLEERCVPTIKVTEDGSHRGRCCQVCRFELRPNTVKDVYFCPTHKVRLCNAVKSQSSYDKLPFVCKDKGFERLTCWEKAHRYYLQGNNCIFSDPPKKGHEMVCCRLKRKHPLVDSRDRYESNLKTMRSECEINTTETANKDERKEEDGNDKSTETANKDEGKEEDGNDKSKNTNDERVGWGNIFRIW